MAERKNLVEFENGFVGVVHATGMDIPVKKEVVEPYDMTFGALASCFYSTFLNFVQKENLNVQKAKIMVRGDKRETVPTTLSWVNLDIELVSDETYEDLEQCVLQASETCSMYQMISHVAKMSWSLTVHK